MHVPDTSLITEAVLLSSDLGTTVGVHVKAEARIR